MMQGSIGEPCDVYARDALPVGLSHFFLSVDGNVCGELVFGRGVISLSAKSDSFV